MKLTWEQQEMRRARRIADAARSAAAMLDWANAAAQRAAVTRNRVQRDGDLRSAGNTTAAAMSDIRYIIASRNA